MSSRYQFPPPGETGGLAGVLMARRSVREYGTECPSAADVGRLLWAAQGITHSSGKRTAPSPHALYPLSLFLVAGSLAEVEPGLYAYEHRTHALEAVGHGDLREELYGASLDDQPWVRDCAAAVVIAGDLDEAVREFAEQPPDGRRGLRYAWIEAGAVAQNIALQAAELGIGTVLVGGFDDERVSRCLGIDAAPLIMMPLGRLPE